MAIVKAATGRCFEYLLNVSRERVNNCVFSIARAVAERARQLGQRISVIAAGERWQTNSGGAASGVLRVALEDFLGAGAVISCLDGRQSPESETAVAGFRSAQADLADILRRCGSGKELIGRGFVEDVELAAQLNVSDVAPLLVEEAYS